MKYAGLVPGKVEQYVIICDGRDISLWEVPSMTLINLARFSVIYFKHYSHGLHIIGLHWLLLKGLKWTLGYFDDFQKEKNKFYGTSGYEDTLDKVIGKENLEKRYGGLLPNKEDNFWPPQLNV